MFLLLPLSAHEMNLLPPHCSASALVKRQDNRTRQNALTYELNGGRVEKMRNTYLV